MDAKNNQLPDINVGNLNFQPMPKRFMVWDKGNQKFMYFIDDDGYERFMVDISELYVLIEEYGYSYEDVVIVQSTNLFDTRGIEIFEGSIVRDEDEGYFSVVECRDGEYCGVDPYNNKVIDSLSAMKLCSEVIGHILSAPELLEESNE